jgi:predicted ester cyclase
MGFFKGSSRPRGTSRTAAGACSSSKYAQHRDFFQRRVAKVLSFPLLAETCVLLGILVCKTLVQKSFLLQGLLVRQVKPGTPGAIIYESRVALPGAWPAAVKEFIGPICATFPDNRITMDDMIAARDKVVLRWSSLGTHLGVMQGIAPTNRKVSANGIAIYRLAAGKVVEVWMNTDQLGILKQLGVVP